MNILFVIVALIGMPLDWVLKRLGYQDLFLSKKDKLPVRAMARSFRCGVITIAFVSIFILFLM